MRTISQHLMLKIGVFGAGHLGKIHLRLLSESNKYELIGFYDSDIKTAVAIEKEFGYKRFENPNALIDAIDVVDIVTPTLFHHETALRVIASKKHIFIEKPLAKTDSEANEIVAEAAKQAVLGQVGHVERFNPAFKSVKEYITHPKFIETHRLAEFNPRGTDVSVVLDLMIHDIDIILSLVKSPIRSIHASGVSVISETPDISNARIEFESGCVANLTASRISLKKMRKSRFFQKDAYIAVDFLNKKVEVVKMKPLDDNTDDLALILQNAEGHKKQIYFENPNIEPTNAIKEELECFADSIEKQQTPIVSLKDGANALAVAHQIIACIESNATI